MDRFYCKIQFTRTTTTSTYNGIIKRTLRSRNSNGSSSSRSTKPINPLKITFLHLIETFLDKGIIGAWSFADTFRLFLKLKFLIFCFPPQNRCHASTRPKIFKFLKYLVPTYLPIYLPTYLPTYPPTYLPRCKKQKAVWVGFVWRGGRELCFKAISP